MPSARRGRWSSGIVDGLRWLGLDWDEGPDIGGPHAPYFQSQRLEMYRDAAARLVRERAAPTTATARRSRSSRSAKREKPPAAAGSTTGPAAHFGSEEIASREAAGVPRAVRFKVPAGTTSFADLVHGPIEFPNAVIEDFVVLRSDAQPTYHLSVVVDDIDMRITQVVRGDDHISNTPKQVLLYNAFGSTAAAVRARAADPRHRQEASEQTPWRDLGDGIRPSRLPAGGDGQLPGAARLVSRRRPGAVHARRARRGVRARRDQRRKRGLQSREARLGQPAVHPATVGRGAGHAARAAAARRGAVERRAARRHAAPGFSPSLLCSSRDSSG